MTDLPPTPPEPELPFPPLSVRAATWLDMLQEKAQRSTASSSLAMWMKHRGFDPAKHHRLILDTIERFLDDPTKQVLLLFAPPGSAKSTIVSVLLPPWYLGRHPSRTSSSPPTATSSPSAGAAPAATSSATTAPRSVCVSPATVRPTIAGSSSLAANTMASASAPASLGFALTSASSMIRLVHADAMSDMSARPLAVVSRRLLATAQTPR